MPWHEVAGVVDRQGLLDVDDREVIKLDGLVSPDGSPHGPARGTHTGAGSRRDIGCRASRQGLKAFHCSDVVQFFVMRERATEGY